MSFENEKSGLQAVANLLDLSIKRGAFGFDDIEKLAEGKAGLIAQYTLLDRGLAGVFAHVKQDNADIPTPKIAIPQPEPEEELEIEESKSKRKGK